MYMSPEVADRKPYGAPSDTYGLGCVLLEMLVRSQLRERRPFETRKDYIHEALDAARSFRWETFAPMCDLAWKMLDEVPKTRIPLPTAGAAAAAAISTLNRQNAAADASCATAALSNGASAEQSKLLSHQLSDRVRPAKRVAAEERRVLASTQEPLRERRRRLQYAD